MESHRKMQIALERLDREHDIRHMIEMNRATGLLIKSQFLARQRRILAYLQRYVITADDISDRSSSSTSKPEDRTRGSNEPFQSIDLLLEGFDADKNDIDRRIYYEVTGRELVQGEFEGEDDWEMSGDEDERGRERDKSSEEDDRLFNN